MQVPSSAPSDPAAAPATDESSHFRSILVSAPDAFISLDPEGIVLEWNDQAEATFGWRRDEIIGRALHDFIIPPEFRDAHVRGLQRFQQTGDGPVVRTRLQVKALHRDGYLIPIELSIAPFRYRNGWGANGFLHDISERHAAEARILASREQLFRQQRTLSSVAEAIPDVIAVIDKEGRIEFVNSAFEVLMGRSRGEVIGGRLDDLRLAQGFDGSGHVARAQRGEPVAFDLELSRGGERRHLSASLIPRRSEEGELDGFVAVLQDITAHKERETRLITLSERDPLTGLANRQGFDGFIRRQGDGALDGVALLYIDLDRFKPVNDTHGHAVGDLLLMAVGERLRALVRPSDLVARIGGDEFVIVLTHMPPEGGAAERIADKVVSTLGQPFELGGLRVEIGASVGVGTGAGQGGPDSWQALIERADAAVYRAKAAGRGRRA